MTGKKKEKPHICGLRGAVEYRVMLFHRRGLLLVLLRCG
jgi:hypothetical protein